MHTVTISGRQIAPITPDQVAEVATAELQASLALLENLAEADWSAPTDCAGWTVHELTAHLAGQYQGLATGGRADNPVPISPSTITIGRPRRFGDPDRMHGSTAHYAR